jgi:mycothione reductase
VPHFDLVIIGSGSGNSIVTPDFDDLEIAVIEAATFGGTCLNVGCIPTKMYVYAAEVANTIRDSSRYGIDGALTQVRWPAIRDRVFGRIDAISAGGREYRAHSPKMTLLEAEARFIAPRTLKLSTGETVTGDRVVVAAGSRATVPDVIAQSGVAFHTSDTVMRIADIPARVTILGGGFIAAEFAHIFSALGTKVTVVVRGNRFLRHLDDDISRRFTAAAQLQWDVRLDTQVTSAAGDTDSVRLELAGGDSIESDLLLVATGRAPNGDRIDAALGGIELHEDGRVVVDEYQRTTADDVWALGDVSSPYQLKHVANHEARVVAHNLAHPEDLKAVDHRFVPAAVFTHPQLATVGRTEDELRESGTSYVTAFQDYGGSAYGWAMEDTTSFCKVIADPESGQLLGAHILGPDASTLIQPIIQAMSYGQSVRGLARGQYWIHPALSEVVENALLNVERMCRPGS